MAILTDKKWLTSTILTHKTSERGWRCPDVHLWRERFNLVSECQRNKENKMNLVKSRDAMLNDYLNGEKPYGVLEDYRRNRNSEEWRASKAAEELCE